MKNEEIVRKVKELYQSVFHEDVEVTIESGSIFIQNYWELRPEKIEVTHNSILGKETKEVNGWGLYAWVETQYSYFEPTDVDEIFICNAENIHRILVNLIETDARERASNHVDAFEFQDSM